MIELSSLGLVVSGSERLRPEGGWPDPFDSVSKAQIWCEQENLSRKHFPANQPSDTIVVYTDGSCWPNNSQGNGGWGCIIITGDKERRLSGFEEKTTNNRMEVLAAIKALESIGITDKKIVIYSDSQYLVSTLSHHWKRKKNLDLWKRMDELLLGKNVTAKWVRGHNGNHYNEVCDKLAETARENKWQKTICLNL